MSLLARELRELRSDLATVLGGIVSRTRNTASKRDLKKLENKIMATQKELAAELAAVLEQQKKTSGEIATVQTSVSDLKTKILELEAIIAAGGEVATQELQDAVAAVKAQAQVIDDQIPDVVVEPDPTPTPEA